MTNDVEQPLKANAWICEGEIGAGKLLDYFQQLIKSFGI